MDTQSYPGPDATTPMQAEDTDEGTQACPRCHQTDFNYEDLDEGTKLVCRDCGFVRDDVNLVHQRGFDDDGLLQVGVHVHEADDGRLAGAALLPSGSAPRQLGVSGGNRHLVLSQNKERLDGALSYLQLPTSIATAARQLLSQVVDAYRAAEPRMQTSPATVAATIYITARQAGRALSLGTAAAALNVQGREVFKEFRRIVGVLDLEVPPPSLEACVMRAAPGILHAFTPESVATHSGPLRGQALVRKALQLTQLLVHSDAAAGRNASVGAAAVWAIILAEDFKDAPSRTYAKQVAAHLQHASTAVQQHISLYEQQLSSLLSLLPFASNQATDIGVQVARHAKTLLKLQNLSKMANSS